MPADSVGWHSVETSLYFKKIFGFGKGTFIIQTLDDDIQHAYFPKFYIDKLYKYVEGTNAQDYKKLARVLTGFYKLRDKCKKEVPKTAKLDLKKLSNKQLIRAFLFNRDWAHRVTPYDQFGWIVEDYWSPIMDKILKNHGLKKNSPEYYAALFTLTKPEEISTTLVEKREIIAQTLRAKSRKISLVAASKSLAKKFGWMPVFAYGTPWEAAHYLSELKGLIKQNKKELEKEHLKLKDYTKIRNREFQQVVEKYGLSPKEQQTFIDFGLALDARNEAEYLVSYCGFYLLPIYDEIARRLFLSVKQLRHLMKWEIVDCLTGKADPQEILSKQVGAIGWVFDKSMTEMKYLTSKEAKRFFAYLNKTSKNVQGNEEGVGLCASPGVARGRAKVTHYPSENNKVKKGDILVTHATTVDYLPAMKRAVAYVTEVGGLTCHAAVVSREFGVPCVVSYKDATKKFKDGDMIEVDADKGVVRKIK